MPQPLCLCQNAQSSDHVEAELPCDAPSTNFVNQELRLSLFGERDRFAFPLMQRARKNRN
jgi:hypothetical protein